MKKYLILLLLGMSLSLASAQTRTWTSSNGKTIEAEIIKVTDTTVSLKPEKGKAVTIKKNLLSEEDNTFINEWAETHKDDLKAKKAKKPMKPFSWGTDYAKAVEVSKDHNVPIVIVFVGPKWDESSQKMDNEVFLNPDFPALANGKIVGLRYELPSKKTAALRSKDGKALLQRYDVRTDRLPYIIFLDPEELLLGYEVRYKKTTPQGFLKNVADLVAKSKT